MVGIPTFLCLALIWLPTLASVGLSFTNWRGITALDVRTTSSASRTTCTLFTKYPFFWPAVSHNLLWLLTLTFIATPIGMFLAVLLDREMRGTRIYQSAFFIPVVLSLAVVGFIWEPDVHVRRASSTRCSARTAPEQRRSTGSATRASTSGPCSSPPAGATSATSWSCTCRA